MKIVQKGKRLVIPVLLASLALAACSSGKETEQAAGTKIEGKENIPITFGTMGKINSLLGERLKSKFPDIQFVSLGTNDVAKLYAQNKVPDIILDLDRVLTPPHLLDKIQYDMSPLVKRHGLKLEEFEPGLLEHVRAYGANGQLYALPYSRFLYGLFYNKNVFDKLQEPYPQKEMTWNEVLELTRKLTRQADGVVYRGFDPLVNDVGYISFMDQYSLSLVDVKSSRALTATPEWKTMASLFRSIYDIPGNRPAKDKLFNPNDFYKNGKVAMTIGYSLEPLIKGAEGKQNIDLVAFPVRPEQQGVGPGTRTENLMITAGAKDKDRAFQVVQYLVSREVQLENSRKGIGTVLKDEAIMKAMGADVEAARGKNVAALFKNRLPSIPAISKYEGAAFLAASSLVPDLAMDEESVDAVLKKMEDLINAAVAAEKAKETK